MGRLVKGAGDFEVLSKIFKKVLKNIDGFLSARSSLSRNASYISIRRACIPLLVSCQSSYSFFFVR